MRSAWRRMSTMTTTTTRVTAIADPKGQLRDCRKRSTRALPMKNTLPPPSNCGMRYSPSREDSHQRHSGHNAGQRQRQSDAEESRDRFCAEIGRRLQQPAVELLEADIDRHDHQRKIAIDNAEQNGSGRVEQADILDADHAQQIGNAARAENIHPGIGSYEQAGPEGHDDQRDQHQPVFRIRLDRQIIRNVG